MANFNFIVNTSIEATKDTSGGSFIGESGVYDITINFVSIEQTKNGAFQFNVNYDYNGNNGTFYGPNIQNKDGSANAIGARILNKLCGIAGIDSGSPLALDEEEHAVGKDNTVKTFVVATDLSGLECKVQVKQIFDKYQGEVKVKPSQSINIVNWFSTNGASADELAAKEAGNEVTLGSQLAKILEDESTKLPKLGKDENGKPVTQAEVDAALAAAKSGNKGGAAAKPAEQAPKKNLFAN